jgi:hypothetical protein
MLTACAMCFAVPTFKPNFLARAAASGESYEQWRNVMFVLCLASSVASKLTRSQRAHGGSVPITVTSIVFPVFFIKGFGLN